MKLRLSCLQQKIKKRVAYIPVLLANWLVFILTDTVLTGVFTDIIDGVCVQYGNSSTAQQTAAYYALFVMYFLPLALMVFCYSRIVYRLRIKVTKRRGGQGVTLWSRI